MNRQKKIKKLFKNCAPFTECTIKINNTQIDYAKYLDAAMAMYNLVENSDNCKIAKIEPPAAIENFVSFEFKLKIRGKTLADIKIAVPIK